MIDEEELKAKRRRKSYLKLNIMSLFFTAVSFISVTLAWFAYSGLVTTQTEVNVKAWYIEFNNKGQAVSNNIVISLDDIYPGMDIVSETIDIKNSGDSPAGIEYKIKSVRFLDEEITIDSQEKILDDISHNYPFHINMALSHKYAEANDGKGNFVVSVSWPLDSGDDEFDTEWGNKAHEFQKAEAEKASKDNTYHARSAIEVVISLEATQYIGEGNAIDPDFMLGNIELYNPYDNQKCDTVSSTCLKTYVIDKANGVNDSSVHLLPDLYSLYNNFDGEPAVNYSGFSGQYAKLTNGWTVVHRSLSASDMLSVVSNDVQSTMMVNDTISNQLVGYVDYGERLKELLNSTIKYNGYFRYKNDLFTYLSSSNCYWLSDKYNANNQFAFVKVDNMFSKIYPEDINNTCRVVPIIEVSKAKLREESSS